MSQEIQKTEKTGLIRLTQEGTGKTIEINVTKEVCKTIYWNERQSDTFFKNDCPYGKQAEGPTDYVVDAHTYSSEVSQEDADRKAKADISKNGQAYANENGTCVTDPYIVEFKVSDTIGRGLHETDYTLTVPCGTTQFSLDVLSENGDTTRRGFSVEETEDWIEADNTYIGEQDDSTVNITLS